MFEDAKFVITCLKTLEAYTDKNIDELARKCAVCEQKCANYEIVMQNTKNVEIAVDRDKIKQKVDEFTTQYILRKIEELDEDFDDLTNELSYYNGKLQNGEELDEYEARRRKFILKLSEWKEMVWDVEETIEDEIDAMSDTDALNFEKNLESLVEQRYERELGELFEQVKSLQV
jgi:sulfur transfer protein SufE